MADFDLSGVGVALVTPFTPGYEIDFDSLSGIVENQIAAGTDFIVMLGSTGEPATLSPAEQDAVIDFVAAAVNGRRPLVQGLGGNSTAAVVSKLKSGLDSRVDAVLSVVPYYNKPSQEGIYRHFMAVADVSPVPVILYNVPSRTGVSMSASTTLRLAEHPRIVGIKEASGNFAQIHEIMTECPDGFHVVSGDDALTLPLMAMGAAGVISVASNAFPGAFSAMVKALRCGNCIRAREINNLMRPLYRLLSVDGNPAGIKALMDVMGLCGMTLRLPLVPASESTFGAIRALSDRLRTLAAIKIDTGSRIINKNC